MGLTDPDWLVRRRSPPHGHRGTRSGKAVDPFSSVAVVLSRRVGGWTGAGLPSNGGNLGWGLGGRDADWRLGSVATWQGDPGIWGRHGHR